MLRHVWIAIHHIPWSNGHVERYICGVYPSGEVAETWCRSEAAQYRYEGITVSRYDDGDIYLYENGGLKRKFIIQAHSVTYQPPVAAPLAKTAT